MKLVQSQLLYSTLFSLVLTAPLFVNSKPTKSYQGLPPILDFYPNCDFEIIDSVTVKKRSKHNQVKSDLMPVLLKILQEKARNKNADALILTSRKIKTLNSLAKNSVQRAELFILSYEAELIKNCEDLSPNKERPAPFVNNGKTAGVEWSIKLPAPSFQSKKVYKFKLRQPDIKQKEVSLENGIYGIKLNSSYQQVVETFGDPSVELDILDKELIVGYGRRHWFHFQQDKLVKINSISPLLSQEILNKIPLHDFFDSYSWKINNSVVHKTSMKRATELLHLESSAIKNDQISMEENGKLLVLDFTLRKDFWTEEKIFSLSGFSLQTRSYQAQPFLQFSPYGSQYKVINTVYSNLLENKGIEVDKISSQLGTPVGTIMITHNTELTLYNSHLYTKSHRSGLSSIHLAEEIFDLGNKIKQPAKPWEIADLRQGQSIEAIRSRIPEDAYMGGDRIEMDLQSHQVVLYFKQTKGKSTLNSAEIILY